MSNRPREDNVIYANFGAKTRVRSASETGGPTSGDVQAPAYSPPAMRVFNAAVRQTDVGRTKRGRDYALEGHVVNFAVHSGGAHAAVVGSQNEPFSVSMQLPWRSRQDISAAVATLVRDPGAVGRMRKGEFSDVMLSALICNAPEEVRFDCDCPDNAIVCKHGVALAVHAAGLIDADPGMILRMRGLTYQELEQRKQDEASHVALENSAPGSEYFWSGRPLPPLPRPRVAPMIEDSDLHLLQRAMQSVSFTNIDQLRAVSDIEDLYHELTRE